jgi:threonine dehydrogenase-like Zn-dependent dehydrogenase
VRDAVPASDAAYRGCVGLGLECSGHEQATLDLCGVVRPYGEVFLVGVPWVAQTEMLAHEVLHKVFYNYVAVHSGWEGRMPDPPAPHSNAHHVATAMHWLAEGKVRVRDAVYGKVSPDRAQAVYQDILHRRLETLTAMFDWRG